MAHTSLIATLCRYALGAALVLGAAGPVWAIDDEDLPDQKILRNVLEAIGLRGPGSDGPIEYRERSPLVVPPTRDLPLPETDAAAKPNPAWPSDPDIRRQKEMKDARKSRKAFSVEDEMRPLTRDELDKGRTTRRSTGPNSEMEKAINPTPAAEQPSYTGSLFNKLIGSFSSGSKEEVATFDREPPRSTLTDPPVGYRTPAPNQPYGVLPEKQKTDPVDRAVGSAATK